MGADHGGAGKAWRGLLLASLSCYLTWVVSLLVGRITGSAVDTLRPTARLTRRPFLALLCGMWRGRGDLVPWIVAALVAIATARLAPGNWYIVAGGLAGSLAGAAVETMRGRARVA